MSLTRSYKALQKKFPTTVELLTVKNDRENLPLCTVEVSKAGIPTLIYTANGHSGYIHSRYNPKEEAERFIAQYSDITGKRVLFIGIGLGYHIEAFINKFPDSSFWVYEPSISIVETLLNVRDVDFFDIKNMQDFCVGTEEIKIQPFLESVFKGLTKDIEIILLPSYDKYFNNEVKTFQTLIYKKIKEITENFYTGIAFEERLAINSIMNVSDILTTPNLLHDIERSYFKDKPAIIVAAGPSLNEEIENLRYIKEHKLAYLFAVGSSINTLIDHHIFPDAVTSYDPQATNYKVVEKVKEQNITTIPLIFGSRVGYETIEGYPGPKLHYVVAEDKLSASYLTRKDGDIDRIYDAPSIAIMTFQLLAKLGSRPIIFVGQNLAFRDDQRYSSGISYVSQSVDEKTKDRAVDVEDVYGNMIKTIVGYDMMRRSLEEFIAYYNCEVINTTKGGAKINGTQFIHLDQVIQDRLHHSVVNDDWITTPCEPMYNIEHFKQEIISLETSMDDLEQIIAEMKNILRQLRKHTDHRDTNKIAKTIDKADQQLKVFFNNKAFEKVIIIMTNTHLQVLFEVLEEVRFETNLFKKGDQIYTELNSYFTRCERTLEEIKDYFVKMKEKVSASLHF